MLVESKNKKTDPTIPTIPLKMKSDKKQDESGFEVPFWCLIAMENDIASVIVHISPSYQNISCFQVENRVRKALSYLQWNINQQVLLELLNETRCVCT